MGMNVWTKPVVTALIKNTPYTEAVSRLYSIITKYWENIITNKIDRLSPNKATNRDKTLVNKFNSIQIAAIPLQK